MLVRYLLLFTVSCFVSFHYCSAQYEPQAPLPGNDAVHYDDVRIKAWATGCTVSRGWMNIAYKDSGLVSAGDDTMAIGAYNASTVSLGDSGVAVLTFNQPIVNGNGPDFAVFENGFTNPLNDSQAFLELAFVEVSSDGVHYVRFPDVCNISDTVQMDNATYSDASLIHNLAGKYIAGYGTPFDLEELKDSMNIDVNNITHIRLVDVIGSINPLYASYDINNHIINDPYTTSFPTGGFDLNAIAVLNTTTSGLHELNRQSVTIYPNPTNGFVTIKMKQQGLYNYMLYDVKGNIIDIGQFKIQTELSLREMSAGLYFIKVINTSNGDTVLSSVYKN